MERWIDSVERTTERYLTWRKRRHLARQAKQAKKNVIVDWIEAFLWAAMVVLLINQYLFQAYQIPSGSMIDTLLIKDRIFVNKLIYGPELVPGTAKLSSPIKPKRNEVIIFENPSYLSKGSVFDVFQRIIYMLTFSLVDIDSDPSGAPRPHFLIKRAVGVEGDRITVDRGEVYIKPKGLSSYLPEKEFRTLAGYDDPTRRMIAADDYPAIEASAMQEAYGLIGLAAPASLSQRVDGGPATTTDMFQQMKARLRVLYQAYPGESRYGEAWRQQETGWYIPKGWIFPMGDNRDNSRDARYFGPVSLKKVLGRAMFKYWPLGRIGAIR
ncbi:signal peptidase I [Sediminispirochaeta bajacaliforniensis]|uniref:signal peptidase I n=1 Tax=Sediminispirochaeta bajacaliforniensis TaxID=148 RepID=UPI000376DA6D|nr:signal peptidase I [Sediminispirochaeta bajacaliforniensis]